MNNWTNQHLDFVTRLTIRTGHKRRHEHSFTQLAAFCCFFLSSLDTRSDRKLEICIQRSALNKPMIYQLVKSEKKKHLNINKCIKWKKIISSTALGNTMFYFVWYVSWRLKTSSHLWHGRMKWEKVLLLLLVVCFFFFFVSMSVCYKEKDDEFSSLETTFTVVSSAWDQRSIEWEKLLSN